MKIKKGVSEQGLQLEMRQVKIHAEAIWKANKQECVITSGTEDGVEGRRAGTLHPYGFALDLRTSYFDESTKHKVAGQLQNILGYSYKVIMEDDHIHVEYRV